MTRVSGSANSPHEPRPTPRHAQHTKPCRDRGASPPRRAHSPHSFVTFVHACISNDTTIALHICFLIRLPVRLSCFPNRNLASDDRVGGFGVRFGRNVFRSY